MPTSVCVPPPPLLLLVCDPQAAAASERVAIKAIALVDTFIPFSPPVASTVTPAGLCALSHARQESWKRPRWSSARLARVGGGRVHQGRREGRLLSLPEPSNEPGDQTGRAVRCQQHNQDQQDPEGDVRLRTERL